MSPKPNARNWNDVQMAIATAAIVGTLGLWNLFATPAKAETAQASDLNLPPTEPPAQAESQPAAMPSALPRVKIMFTAMPATSVTSQTQPNSSQTQTNKKKKNKNNNGGSVTQTKSS